MMRMRKKSIVNKKVNIQFLSLTRAQIASNTAINETRQS